MHIPVLVHAQSFSCECTQSFIYLTMIIQPCDLSDPPGGCGTLSCPLQYSGKLRKAFFLVSSDIMHVNPNHIH